MMSSWAVDKDWSLDDPVLPDVGDRAMKVGL
jgi:hypothetical protein